MGENHLDYALSCNNLAFLYTDQELFDQAEPLLMESKGIYADVLGKESTDYATACNNLAYLYKHQRYYAQAEQLYGEAKNIWGIIYGNHHPKYAKACNNLSALYEAQGKYAQAAPLIKEANQILLNQLNINFQGLSEQERVFYFQTLNHNLESYNSFVIKAYRQMPELTSFIFDNTLTTKGLMFQSSQKIRQQILTGQDKKLQQKFRDWQIQKEYLANYYTLNKNPTKATGLQSR